MATLNPTYTAPNVLPSGAIFADLQAGGLAKLLDQVLAALVATAAPTSAPTLAATGGGASGGLLAAGTYYATITETNGLGETTASPESTLLTVAATNKPRVTFPTLKAGNVARNVYLTPVNGATGTEVLYAAGITAATYDLLIAAPTGTAAAPLVNTTAVGTGTSNRVRGLKQPTLAYRALMKPAQAVQNYTEGDPAAQVDVLALLTEGSATFRIVAQAIDDAAALIAANPGTLAPTRNSAGDYLTRRTFP